MLAYGRGGEVRELSQFESSRVTALMPRRRSASHGSQISQAITLASVRCGRTLLSAWTRLCQDMRPTRALCFAHSVRHATSPPLVRIKDATFFRRQPSTTTASVEGGTNRPLFPNLNFTVDSDKDSNQYWAIIGPSNAGKTTFFEVLQGQHLCFPPIARSYPYLSTEELLSRDSRLSHPSRAIQHVSFSGNKKGLAGMGTYLSARYESRREATDFSVLDYLKGNTQLNGLELADGDVDHALLDTVIKDLRLGNLAAMPLSNLSNGQTRRARIAKALLAKPELLLLDEPFMGLDPPTTIQLNPLLRRLAQSCSPRLFISLRTQDPIPDWITHVAFLGEELQITHQGPRDEILEQIHARAAALKDSQTDLDGPPHLLGELGRFITDFGIIHGPRIPGTLAKKQYDANKEKFYEGNYSDRVLKAVGVGDTLGLPAYHIGGLPNRNRVAGEPLVEMEGVRVKYGDHVALGGWDSQETMKIDDSTGEMSITPQSLSNEASSDPRGLWWNVHRGQRWAVIGPNGSGKSTLMSLILSDHPQAYSQPVRIFGRSRLPKPGQPGISVFDIQRRIGHSSPEVQAFFPKTLSVRSVLESAYADTPMGRPELTTDDDNRISACLRWFQAELNPSAGMDELLRTEMNRRGKFVNLPYVQHGISHRDYDKARKQFWYDFDRRQEASIAWADSLTFGELTFSAQRVALFLRAIVAQPDIVILDEAFGGMDENVRDKCILFLENGESRTLTPFIAKKGWTIGEDRMMVKTRDSYETRGNIYVPEGLTDRQALICISHVAAEVPPQIEDWIYLPEAGSGELCRMGTLTRPLRNDPQLWNTIWGMRRTPSRSARIGGYGMYYDFENRKAESDRLEALMERQKMEKKLGRKVSDEEFQSETEKRNLVMLKPKLGAGRPKHIRAKNLPKRKGGRPKNSTRGQGKSSNVFGGYARDGYQPENLWRQDQDGSEAVRSTPASQPAEGQLAKKRPKRAPPMTWNVRPHR